MASRQRTARERYTPDKHLNLNVRGLSESATLAINEKSARLAEQGRRVFRLGLGQSPFPVPDPVAAALSDNARQKDYLPVRGLKSLRQAVAAYYHRSQGVDVAADGVLIGPGSKELMFLLQLVYYGDLLIPTPSWVSYAPQASILGRQIRWLETRQADDWKLTPEALDRHCGQDPERPRILILNYPNNPTGASYASDDLRALAEVARRYRVILVSDEIYGEIHHRGQHVSVARYYPEGTVISSGLSKWCGAGGWRLGTFVFPRGLYWLLDAMAVAASETYTATSAPIQYAAVRAFREGQDLEDYLTRSRRLLGSLGRWCHRQLAESGLEMPRPTGGFYLFPDFGACREALAARGIETSAALCERLLEGTGVAILPGSDFGRPESELTARLAYVDFDGSRALAAAADRRSEDMDEAFLREVAPNVTGAVDRMRQWLKGN